MASHECDQEREAKILTEAPMMEQYKDLWISGHATPGYPGANNSTPGATVLNRFPPS